MLGLLSTHGPTAIILQAKVFAQAFGLERIYQMEGEMIDHTKSQVDG
jgi:hypothetical protein